MGNPVPTLKIILILMIIVDAFWLSDRLLSILGVNLFELLPSSYISLIAAASSLLLILFNILMLGLLSRLQLKPE